MSLTELRQEYSKCNKCSALCKSRSQVVFGSGKEDADVLFIGEAPGASEDREGIPFCGASGQILQDLLKSVGLTREDVFITNTILCRPENNRNPNRKEVDACRSRLDKLISLMGPKVVVTIGNFATERITGKIGITKLRGRAFSVEIDGQQYNVVPVIHPANLLYNGRNPEILEQMKKDFIVIKKVIQEATGRKLEPGQARLMDF
ncbi:MAG: uracil-DNA glycosylase [archaeon]